MNKSKIFIFVTLTVALLVIFTACDSSNNSATKIENQKQTNQNPNRDISDTPNPTDSSTDSTKSHNSTIENKNHESDQTSSEQNIESNEIRSQYSSKQIEYARIWLQLGPNQQIDELYVRHISAGEPINPIDKTSAAYPSEVIQLSGSRLIDGSVTYSGNGNGTINVYNVPLRWDGKYPAGKSFYTDIIQNTELVPIDVGDEKEIIRLIKLITIHHD